MDYKKILEAFNKLVSKNNIYNLLIVFLVGVLVLIVSNFFKSTTTTSTAGISENKENQVTNLQISNYEVSKRAELKNMISKMQGVGQVDVMIYFESGEELVPAVNINNGVSSTKEKDNEGGERNTTQENKGSQVVITSRGGDSEPLILKKNYPKVTGVMILAEGAEDKQINYSITKAVSVLFDIPNNKVNVYPMKR